jgi:hypothetical protein
MAVEIKWIITGRILLVDLIGNVPLDEFRDAVDQANKELNHYAQPPYAHVIFKSTDAMIPPTNVKLMREITQNYFVNPHLGYTIIISNDQVHRFLSSVTAQMFQSRWRSFSTYQEGMSFLETIDKTLANA